MNRDNDCRKCEILADQLAATKRELEKLTRLVTALANAAAVRATIDAGDMRRGDMSRGQYGFIHGRFTQCNTTLSALGRETIPDPTQAKGSGSALFSGFFGGLK